MRKLLFLLCAMLLFALPAVAENIPGMVDMTHLTELKDKEVPALVEKLNATNLVKACDLRGVKISREAQLKLLDNCPNVDFYWEVDVNKSAVDNHVTHLNLDELPNKVGYKKFKDMLRCFSNLEEITMFSYRYSLKEMESIFADFPQIEFHWTIRLDNYLIPNDATAFSTNKGRREPRYTPQQLRALSYCENLVALDVGHNNVSDLSFLTQWPGLRIFICVDSRTPVKDISPLKDMHDLEYVELFMQNITDISALEGKTKLLDLNLCYNDITDLTPLHSCVNLQRLWISNNKHLPQEQIDALQAALPNLVIETETKKSTEAGWREHPRYFTMRESFESHYYVPFSE
ncbi:MAG: hypothetical protein IJX84_08320 [Clostridia bacterium]|nr:hypothetical protein [Clostridia bacterium]